MHLGLKRRQHRAERQHRGRNVQRKRQAAHRIRDRADHDRPERLADTISFGIGQTLGPIVVGAITDAMGSLSFALNVSAAMLALGAVLAAFQPKVQNA